MPSLAVVMTPFPYSLGVDATLDEARQMMEEHTIHHLPVTDDGQLVGIVSLRDLAVAGAMSVDAEMSLDVVYRTEPLVVDIKTPLDDVVVAMFERRVDSALVTRNAKLVGILTYSDVAKLLATILREVFPVAGDDQPA